MGYMNCDLLLHSSFVESLEKVYEEQKNGNLQNRVMVMGRRYNVETSTENDYTSFTAQQFDELIERNTAFTDMFISVAQDFFIYNHGALRLDDYPLSKLVIGRNGYDNYMVDYCFKNNISLIDISQSCSDLVLFTHSGRVSPDGWRRKLGRQQTFYRPFLEPGSSGSGL